MVTNLSLSDIQGRRQEIANAAEQLASEDKRLAEAEALLLQLAKSWGPLAPLRVPAFQSGPVPASVTRVSSGKRVTKKSMMMECLAEPSPRWQTANQIKDAMTERTGSEVKMSSISPALTDLKNEGLIVRDDLMVASAERVKREQPEFFYENEPPKGGSDNEDLMGPLNDTQDGLPSVSE